MIEWLPLLPSKSCYINLKCFETLKDTPNTSEGFRFVAFVVLEILGWVLFDPPLVLDVGTKTLGTLGTKTLACPSPKPLVPKPLVPEGLKPEKAISRVLAQNRDSKVRAAKDHGTKV